MHVGLKLRGMCVSRVRCSMSTVAILTAAAIGGAGFLGYYGYKLAMGLSVFNMVCPDCVGDYDGWIPDMQHGDTQDIGARTDVVLRAENNWSILS